MRVIAMLIKQAKIKPELIALHYFSTYVKFGIGFIFFSSIVLDTVSGYYDFFSYLHSQSKTFERSWIFFCLLFKTDMIIRLSSAFTYIPLYL